MKFITDSVHWTAIAVTVLLLNTFCPAKAFSPSSLHSFTAATPTQVTVTGDSFQGRILTSALFERISNKRRKELGIPDGADEYDLDQALNNNTDPLISKIIAGSFILVMITLLVVGVVIPYTTDYGEGVCNPILTGGRC